MKVAVIGGGAAGCAAALKLKSRQHSVVVFRKGPGASAVSSGCFDLLDPRYARHGSVEQAYRVFLEDQPMHPLTRLKVTYAEIRNALVDWARYLEAGGLPCVADFEKGLILANVWGNTKWSLMAQASFSAGDLRQLKNKKIGVVVFEDHQAVMPQSLIQNLTRLTKKEWPIEVVSLSLKSLGVAAGQLFQFALKLDQKVFFERVLEQLKKKVPVGIRALAFPPVWGLRQSAQNMKELESALGVPCFEWAATHDSVPGMRLHYAMEKALAQYQIPIEDATVEKIEKTESGWEVSFRRLADEAEVVERLEFNAVVLAGGRYLGGGLKIRQHGPVEPLMGLSVFAPENADRGTSRLSPLQDQRGLATTLFETSFFAKHRGLMTGLSSGESLEIERGLWAVGSLVGGWDPFRDHAGLVASVAFGMRCGEML